MYIIRLLLFSWIWFVAITGCERPSNNSEIIRSEDSVYFFVDEVMKYYYLWNDKVPNVDIYKYNSPSDLLDDLKYNALDKWSFIGKANVIGPLFQEGKYFGFGFYLKWDENHELRVVVVYENSDAYNAGLRRGNRINQINGIDVNLIIDFNPFFDGQSLTWTFEVCDNNDQLYEITLSKSTVTQNSVLYHNIYNVSGHKTGYLVFDSFLGYSQVEMEEAFTYFRNNNISELIIDLRYNGGGYSNIAEEMADMIILSSDVGKEFYSLEHNNNIASEFDTTIRFHSNSLNLNLSRVFFITTEMSASASELLINGLKPYLNVLLIGQNTHGKPVGMYEFDFQDWIFLPVMFRVLNAVGYGDYYNGLSVDKIATDGIDKDWGDETEPSLYQAFHYISFGEFDNTVIAYAKSTSDDFPGKTSLKKLDLLLFNK